MGRALAASCLALQLVVVTLATGCVGEAEVSYHGTVTEGTSSGYSFDAKPNPRGAKPVAGAKVELCIDQCPGRTVTTAADGSFPVLTRVFGGFIGHLTHIIVRATAPDGRSVTYETTYEKTSDPTMANRSTYLNLRIGPGTSSHQNK